jgi:hypothetical protein
MDIDATGRAERLAFREATDALTEHGVPLQRVAEAFEVRYPTVHRWRAEDDRRRPRDGWRDVIAQLAAEYAELYTLRAAALRKLAGAGAGRARRSRKAVADG